MFPYILPIKKRHAHKQQTKVTFFQGIENFSVPVLPDSNMPVCPNLETAIPCIHTGIFLKFFEESINITLLIILPRITHKQLDAAFAIHWPTSRWHKVRTVTIRGFFRRIAFNIRHFGVFTHKPAFPRFGRTAFLVIRLQLQGNTRFFRRRIEAITERTETVLGFLLVLIREQNTEDAGIVERSACKTVEQLGKALTVRIAQLLLQNGQHLADLSGGQFVGGHGRQSSKGLPASLIDA
ncbi:MAG: hypothetical protein A2286_12020 [Gammaproteobacteria bacterium RIFOXYA12_FULL_61_12]|nr:MAG: hypothetical protein A2286_12020 [Gammaproteobacteria bacterium RIFOXYA12_FULL_61_12]